MEPAMGTRVVEESEKDVAEPEKVVEEEPAAEPEALAVAAKRSKPPEICGVMGCVLPNLHAGLHLIPGIEHLKARARRGPRPSDLKVGARVRVSEYWADATSYDGVVIATGEELTVRDQPTFRFRVQYDDGDKHWHTLNEVDVQLLPSAPGKDES